MFMRFAFLARHSAASAAVKGFRETQSAVNMAPALPRHDQDGRIDALAHARFLPRAHRERKRRDLGDVIGDHATSTSARGGDGPLWRGPVVENGL